jgi:hypothetical protein
VNDYSAIVSELYRSSIKEIGRREAAGCAVQRFVVRRRFGRDDLGLCHPLLDHPLLASLIIPY